MSIQAHKQQLRRQFLDYRHAHHRDIEPQASETICDRLLALPFLHHLNHHPKYPVVSGYIPMQGEVNVLPAMTHLHAKGLSLCLPVVVAAKSPLLFRQWHPNMPLEDGVFQTRIPPLSSPVLSPNILLVPLIAFDRRCHRIGFGAGFYDRTLETLRQQKPQGTPQQTSIVAIGVAFSFQEVPEVPTIQTDQILDMVVTETEIISSVVSRSGSGSP